eukprot:3668969-Prymnesium_polylepis.1
MCNGILSGLVSITAGCATAATWAAVLIGGTGALVYTSASSRDYARRLEPKAAAECRRKSTIHSTPSRCTARAVRGASSRLLSSRPIPIPRAVKAASSTAMATSLVRPSSSSWPCRLGAPRCPRRYATTTPGTTRQPPVPEDCPCTAQVFLLLSRLKMLRDTSHLGGHKVVERLDDSQHAGQAYPRSSGTASAVAAS